MRRIIAGTTWLILFACSLGAQQPAAVAEAPAFEVVSIKPNNSGLTSGGSRWLPGGRFTASNVALTWLLSSNDIPNERVLGGPDWIRNDRYDIEARAGADVTPPEMQARLARMVREHFGLVAHREERVLPVYALVVPRADRLKMTPTRVDCDDPVARAALVPASDGVPVCGFRQTPSTFRGGGISMATLTNQLGYLAGRSVVNRTNLAGSYDVRLEWAAEGEPAGERVSIFTAVQEQLGLQLKSDSAPLPVLVIDRVSRPAAN